MDKQMATARFITKHPRRDAETRRRARYAREFENLVQRIARNRAKAQGTTISKQTVVARQIATDKIGNYEDWLKS